MRTFIKRYWSLVAGFVLACTAIVAATVPVYYGSLTVPTGGHITDANQSANSYAGYNASHQLVATAAPSVPTAPPTPTPFPSPTCATTTCSFSGVVLTVPTPQATGCGVITTGPPYTVDTTACGGAAIGSVTMFAGTDGSPAGTLPGTGGQTWTVMVHNGFQETTNSNCTIGSSSTGFSTFDSTATGNTAFNAIAWIDILAVGTAPGGASLTVSFSVSGCAFAGAPNQPWVITAVRTS